MRIFWIFVHLTTRVERAWTMGLIRSKGTKRAGKREDEDIILEY
jgi:hypothetical protein